MLAARGWGRYYASESFGLSGAVLHFMMFIMYVQSITVMERIGAGVHLLSIMIIALRVIWWSY